MPRSGLAPASVTKAGAGLADELGYDQLGMGVLAQRLGVKTPSLYKHVDSLADLARRVAVLAATELGDAIRDATQGRSGSEALRAAAQTMRTYAEQHPGRYAAINRAHPAGPNDPLVAAQHRLLDSFAATLMGYRLDPTTKVHALRMVRSMLHGFVTLDAAHEFQLETDVNDSFTWMTQFIDHGLKAMTPDPTPSAASAHQPRPA